MITRKSSALSVSLEKQNLSEMFPPSSVRFQSYLFVKVYWGLKNKLANIVRIVVFYQCISTGFYLLGGGGGAWGSFPPKVFFKKI